MGMWQAPAQPEWFGDAVCRSTDPEAFYPGRGESAEPAKRICQRCPVSDECLIYALRVESEELGHRFGVWGGMSPTQRQRLARSLNEAS